MYFEKFPKIEYNDVIIPDLSIRYKINDLVRQSVNTYELYRLSESEKPEDVSYRIYGEVTYHWVVLLMNDITDPLDEWFRNDVEMDLYINDLYDDPDGVHHYEDGDGYVINELDNGDDVTISNREYEERLNNAKREIKILRPEYLYQLINEFESTVNG